VGTWLLKAPGETDKKVLVNSLMEALRGDARVLEVRPPEFNDYWTLRRTFYPDSARSTQSAVRTGADAFEVLQLSEFVGFTVRVPIKNQEPHQGTADIPSDTYWVAWDGVTILVMWEQEGDWVPISGGHIVQQVLDDVLAPVGCGLYIQSCSPGCDFLFVHETLLLTLADDVEDFNLRRVPGTRALLYAAERRYSDPLVEVDLVALSLSADMAIFAMFKNVGRRLIDLEHFAREDFAHLLSHYHEHTSLVAEGKSPKVLLARWNNRHWRKEAWALISGVWLAMANIETLRRIWNSERGSLAEAAQIQSMLTRDTARDVESVEALDLDPIAETVNQVTAALNNQTSVRAAALGALAGGLAGGATGLLGG